MLELMADAATHVLALLIGFAAGGYVVLTVVDLGADEEIEQYDEAMDGIREYLKNRGDL